MFRFYGKLLLRALAILWRSTERFLTVGTVVLTVTTYYNQALGDWLLQTWQGIPRWWALLPVGLLFAYGLLRANYETFQAVESERIRLQAGATTDEKRLALKDALGAFNAEGREFTASVSQQQVEDWATRTQELIKTALGEGEAELFLSDSGYVFYGGGRVENWARGRLNRLAELIGRVDSVRIRPDFDPQEWTDPG
jgi:hypothetical protein